MTDDYYPYWVYEDDEESEEDSWEELLAGLYCPGGYEEGERICRDLLEIDPDWQPAQLYLTLNLTGLGRLEEALVVMQDLSDDMLFEALSQLAQSSCSDSEEELYQQLMVYIRERGLGDELEVFFSTVEEAPEWHEPVVLPPASPTF